MKFQRLWQYTKGVFRRFPGLTLRRPMVGSESYGERRALRRRALHTAKDIYGGTHLRSCRFCAGSGGLRPAALDQVESFRGRHFDGSFTRMSLLTLPLLLSSC